MKKITLTFLLFVLASYYTGAYATDTFITGFEVGDNGCQVNDEFGAWFSGYTWSYVENPQTTGINNSARCLMTDSSLNPTDPDSWGYWVALKLTNPITITAENRYLKIMAKRSPNTTTMSVGTDVNGERGYYGRMKPAVAGTWGDMVVDLFDAGSSNSLENKVVSRIYISLGTWDATEKGVCFLDNVVLSNDSKPRGATEIQAGLLANFDNETLTSTNFAGFETQSAESSYEIAANPLETTVNNSKKCLLYNKPANTVWWNSLLCTPNGIITVTYPNIYMHLMMYIPDVTNTTIIVNSTSGTNVTEKVYPTSGNEWYDYVLDVSELTYINQIAFRFNQTTEDNWANPAGVYYVDDFVLNSSSEPRTKITSGIKNVVFDNLKIYAKEDEVNIESTELKSVSVFSINGQLINKKNITGTTASFKLSHGLYLIKAVNKAGGVSLSKFIM